MVSVTVKKHGPAKSGWYCSPAVHPSKKAVPTVVSISTPPIETTPVF
jgi:hypothetical protein